MTLSNNKTIVLTLLALFFTYASAVPMPIPIPNKSFQAKRPTPTAAPLSLQSLTELRAVLDFYDPSEVLLRKQEPLGIDQKIGIEWSASPVKKRQQGYPTFPAQYPSCYNCQQKYSSLSSCMEASSVFKNASSIFDSPWSYISVLKCSCTDTFQSEFPQCVECFQLTNQCEYLGTDSEGTGAPEIVSNIRTICAFASSVLGKAQSANYPTYNFTYTPSVVPSYTDVTSQGPGYLDQATGAIFSSGASGHMTSTFLYSLLVTCLLLSITPLIML